MIDQETAGPEAASQRQGMWPTLLLAVLMLLSGAGITWLVVSDPPPPSTEALEPVPDENVAQVVEVVTPAFITSDEPIADAAEIILPSVVQIQTFDSAGNSTGVGSGIIYDSDGLILTAAHVVVGEETVTVRLADGEEIQGTVIGGDSDFDVAVVKVERTGLPAASLALDGDPRVGQLAIAVGSPWGLQSTVTAGIISAVNQSIRSTTGFRAVLQTDAAINPGNSGGALVDRHGRVLGINVSIFSLSGANDGVGFAVPIDVAYDIAGAVLAGESLDFAFLGVSGENVDSGQAGAVITEVFEDTGAAEAGVESGDLVIFIDGVAVQGIADLAAQVKTHRPGTTVELVIIRDGEQLAFVVTLGERPEEVDQ